MDVFHEKLNELIVNAFRSVLKIEEQTLRKLEKVSLSINEMHLIEAVGKEEGKGQTISEIARELSLSLPSVTVAVNKLEKKGLLQKRRKTDDGRAVVITQTELGYKIERVHHRFHENMVRSIADGMTDKEKEALLKGMEKLNLYFNKKLTEESVSQPVQGRG